jgi:uncharacterized protein (DUF1684 family)
MSELTNFREQKDSQFGVDHQSPLTEEQRATFRGLYYYEERPQLRYVAGLTPSEHREVVDMQTSTGTIAKYVRYGKVSFEVDEDKAELTIFEDEGGTHLFLPFADATSGHETYGAGRYLDVEVQPDGQILVDFNYAYNPYCAYNVNWTCPLTPAENRLRVSIRAGEKLFEEH